MSSSAPLPVKCSIAASDGGLKATVESTAAVPIEADVHVVLALASADRAPEYWAPVDLGTGQPYGANQPRHLRLRPGQILTATLQPAALLWDRSISSVWPSRPLGEVVPSGRYSLRLEIEGPQPGHRATSNSLAVDLHGVTLTFAK